MTKALALDLSALAAGAKESAPIERTRSADSKFANNPFVELVKANVGKTLELPAVGTTEEAKEIQSFLRDAADKADLGLSTSITPVGKKYKVKFSPKPKRASGGIANCPVCKEDVTVTADKKIRIHGPRDNRCSGSGTDVSAPATAAVSE